MKRCIVPIFIAALFASCKKSSDVSVTPGIQFISMTPNSIRAGNTADTLFLKLNITDGDGDLGTSDYSRIYFKDRRTDVYNTLPLPDASKDLQNPGTSIKALYTLKFPASVYFPHKDSLQFELYIKDNAGHESNHVLTPEIFVN